MTTICVKVSDDGNRIVFGSDRNMNSGDMKLQLPHPKWRKVDLHGQVWVAISGWLKFLPYLEASKHELMTAIDDSADNPSALCTFLQSMAERTGIKPDDNGCWNTSGFIIAAGYGAWYFGGDMMPTPIRPGVFRAAGSGREYAFGAYSASNDLGAQDFQTVKNAVLAGIRYDTGSALPLDMYEMTSDFQVKHHEFN